MKYILILLLVACNLDETANEIKRECKEEVNEVKEQLAIIEETMGSILLGIGCTKHWFTDYDGYYWDCSNINLCE